MAKDNLEGVESRICTGHKRANPVPANGQAIELAQEENEDVPDLMEASNDDEESVAGNDEGEYPRTQDINPHDHPITINVPNRSLQDQSVPLEGRGERSSP